MLFSGCLMQGPCGQTPDLLWSQKSAVLWATAPAHLFYVLHFLKAPQIASKRAIRTLWRHTHWIGPGRARWVAGSSSTLYTKWRHWYLNVTMAGTAAWVTPGWSIKANSVGTTEGDVPNENVEKIQRSKQSNATVSKKLHTWYCMSDLCVLFRPKVMQFCTTSCCSAKKTALYIINLILPTGKFSGNVLTLADKKTWLFVTLV